MESNQEQEQDQIDEWQDDSDEVEETCRSCGCAEMEEILDERVRHEIPQITRNN